MSDLQEVLDAVTRKSRMEQFAESGQLSLGELILMFDAIDDYDKRVIFDSEDVYPTGFGGWRGSYRELAIRYSESLDDSMTAGEFRHQLKEQDGAEHCGWKGGDFTMSRQTPVWVANRGTLDGFADYDDIRYYQAVTGIEERTNVVSIQTAPAEF